MIPGAQGQSKEGIYAQWIQLKYTASINIWGHASTLIQKATYTK